MNTINSGLCPLCAGTILRKVDFAQVSRGGQGKLSDGEIEAIIPRFKTKWPDEAYAAW